MSTEPLGDAIRRMGRSAGLQGPLEQTDDQLLERFVARRDEPAFAALMVRHGPMVLYLCRQMLRDAQEAEDAFQAAFLVLVRNARTIRKRPSLSAWLYGVAYKVAARLRGRAERRRLRELPGLDLSAVPAVGEPVAPDLRFVLHEEIHRLPVKYRIPVVLCYLEGKTNEEAARTLQWPAGTVKARLSRARDMLRMRLGRRGLGTAAVLLTDEPAPSAARNTASVVPLFLLESTIRAAMRLAAKGVAVAMPLAKVKGAAVVLLAAFVLGAGATSMSKLAPPQDGNAASNPAPAAPSAKAATPEPTTDVAKEQPKPAPEKTLAPSSEMQAHPYPQQPMDRKVGPDKTADDPVCMMDG
ncbi:MAG TPA: RNA polymerase sigma factor [Gemmataceae bacterium]|nr:RNA polymerase sigma factor [Gemmataceae bacterium]